MRYKKYKNKFKTDHQVIHACWVPSLSHIKIYTPESEKSPREGFYLVKDLDLLDVRLLSKANFEFHFDEIEGNDYANY